MQITLTYKDEPDIIRQIVELIERNADVVQSHSLAMHTTIKHKFGAEVAARELRATAAMLREINLLKKGAY